MTQMIKFMFLFSRIRIRTITLTIYCFFFYYFVRPSQSGKSPITMIDSIPVPILNMALQL